MHYLRYFFIIILFKCAFIFAKSNVDEQLQAHIKYNPDGPNTIGYIAIDDRKQGISDATWLYVKKALEYYKEQKPQPIFIILELNTPGGEVFAAQKISDALKEIDTQYDIPVVSFINNWAISAGSMLAYSTRFIAATNDSSMGAAEPIIMGESGKTEAASEKVNSAIRSDFANRARFFGRNPLIAEAMVDKDMIIVERDGKIIKLDSESQIRSAEPNPDKVISPKGKLLTLNAEELIRFGVADFLVQPAKLSPITENEREKGLWPANKSLLFQYPFFAKIPQATINEYKMDWKTKFFVFLASPVVSSILVIGLMIGFYLEISHPGFGLPGTIALLCLFLIALSSLSLEIANWLELILLVTGLVVLLVDIFVLPTFGLLGIIGVILFVAGLFGMLLPNLKNVQFDFDTNTINAAGTAFFIRLAQLCLTLVIGFSIIMLLARFVTPKAAAWSRLVLTGSEQEGYTAGQQISELPKPGTKGTAFSTLRPAGKIRIDETIYDAMAQGSYIEQGAAIIVTRIDGNVIMVDEAQL